ncbi:hypothetical protein KEM44_23295 [Sinorhizobium meliloti]|uniref:hypothetical protein n=1 Tax=Rhizobium meliloti TaxID=382 RepID=UPI0012FE005D|nr:hypothetical protein [Sinorhizobium meliloti]MCK3783068.1 hypothetical protein [Sinorhizobium meliloti]MCK3788302.1 hypothetical protein [Sinorhizobium meliloti]MCK3794421.1 hypothetical protein [Sinorhizobium meliloti]UTG96528.1 hypothetical protein KEM44_23295 [Sinorhizobium meliloti]
MSEFARAKQRYRQNQHDARRAAVANLEPHLQIKFQITEWSHRSFDAIANQWKNTEFDWSEIRRRFREPDQFEFAIWQGERLCGIGLALTTGQSVKVKFVEGDPRLDCPLKGRRMLVALEAIANYAQARGKKDIILEPLNEKLVDLYENTFGFDVVRPRTGAVYCRKKV